jgi:uncharacterized phage-associated protein
MAEFAFRPEKLQQVVLLAAHRLNNGSLGKTKLFKLLYYVDFDHFEKHGAPVTGDTYIRQDFGPVPEHGDLAIKQLADAEQLKIGQTNLGGFLQYTFEPLAKPDLTVFTAEEVATIDGVFSKWERHSASELVAATHGEAPWIGTRPGNPISYSLAYYRNRFGEMDEFLEEHKQVSDAG